MLTNKVTAVMFFLTIMPYVYTTMIRHALGSFVSSEETLSFKAHTMHFLSFNKHL